MRCSSRSALRQTRVPNLSSRSAFRRPGAARMACMASKADVNSHDLLIVGPGVLGSYLGTLWKEQHPDSRVVCESISTGSHDSLKARGFEARTADDAGDEKFPFVAFTAPPTQNPDYPAAIRGAAEHWDGTGTFAYSGVAAVYKTTNGPCDETDELQSLGTSERIDRLLNAEAAALDAGGNVLRLVGLYHKTRGPHTFFLKKGTIERNGEGVINMVHYEDAARLMLAVRHLDQAISNASTQAESMRRMSRMMILQGDGSDSEFHRGQAFTGSDNHPVSYRKMMDAVAESGVLEGSVEFTGTEEPSGKLMDSSQTDARLGFTPKYASFESFFLQNKGADVYNQE